MVRPLHAARFLQSRRRSISVSFFTLHCILIASLEGCYRKLQDNPRAVRESDENAVPLQVSLPLSNEMAAALNGVAAEGELVADIEVNGELVAEGIRGGVRGGVRGDVAGGVRGGVRGAEASGVRGGVWGAPAHPSTSSGRAGYPAVRGEPVEPRLQTGDHPPASDDQIAFAFEVTFLMPKKAAKDGENSIRTRVRPGQHQDVPLVEVKTTVKMRVQGLGVGDQTSGLDSGLTPDPGTLAPVFQIEIEEKSLSVQDVELPDLDGNGVATLTEVAAILAAPPTGDGKRTSGDLLQQAIAIASDATSTQKPTQEQVQVAFLSLATKLETKVKDDFKAAGVAPPASVKIEIKEIDLTPPDTALSAVSGQSSVVSGQSVRQDQGITFTFNCSENACTFRCSPDGEAFSPCSSPLTPDPQSLTPGEHKFAAFAIDAMGNRDTTPATLGFTVLPPPPAIQCGDQVCEAGETAATCPGDCPPPVVCGDKVCASTESEASCAVDCDKTPPQTAISSQPSAVSSQTSAKFEFTCSDSLSTQDSALSTNACSFMCQLDIGTPAPCASPVILNVSEGSHTFSTYAVDAVGNKDETPATYAWTVDTKPPAIAISGQPAALSNQTSVSFSFACSDPVGAGVPAQTSCAFACKLDQPLAPGAFATCTSPLALSLSKGGGSYTFTVQGTDAAGNTGTASHTWTLDLAAPGVTITSQPPNPSYTTTASFSFTSAETGAAFECSLDSGSFAACASPKAYSGLTGGSHTFTVRTTDSAGNVGSASHTWTVTPDSTAPVVSNLILTNSTPSSLTFSWSAQETGSGVASQRVSYDTDAPGAPYNGTGATQGNSPISAGTASSFTLSGLAGTCTRYFIAVSATDNAGNVGADSIELPAHTPGCGGNGSFATAVNYNTGANNNSRGIIAGDFNADNILDLALSRSGTTSFSRYQGNGTGGKGDGTFAGTSFSQGGLRETLTYGDFNSDGIVDIALLGNSAAVTLSLGAGTNGKGNGSFSAPSTYTAASGMGGAATGDFNDDGIMDVAAANGTAGQVSILIGNGSGGRGDGTLAAFTGYGAGTNVTHVLTDDFNADGIADLATTAGTSAYVLLGNGSNGKGNGTFGSNLGYAIAGSTTYWGLVKGDFNADGITDLAASTSPSTVSVLMGNGSNGKGNGSFAARVDYSAGGIGKMSAADFNSDRILDLVIVSGSSSYVLFGNGSNGKGDGTFANGAAKNGGLSAGGVAIGDYDADNILDLAICNDNPSNNLSIVLGTGKNGVGNGSFARVLDLPVGASPRAVTAADFNEDGILDLSVAANATGNVDVLIGGGSGGQGTGSFAAPTSYAIGVNPSFVTAGDFNDDSIIDLAVTNPGASAVTIRFGSGSNGQGNGGFSGGTNYSVGSDPRSIVVGDFNHDKTNDLAIANYGSNTIRTYHGNGTNGQGNGTFTLAMDIAVGSGPVSIAVGDFNDDAIQDLAIANQSSNNVTVLLGGGTNGQGDGTFVVGSNLPLGAGTAPKALIVGDFNDDAIPDLAVALSGSNSAGILLGNGSGGQGDGTFGVLATYAAGTAPSALAQGDFNRDGIADLAVANDQSSDVSILIGGGTGGQGNGAFASPTNYSAAQGPSSITAGDFDGDSILDLAVTAGSAGKVTILLGQGPLQ